MANPDIAAALVALDVILVAADAAASPTNDIARGLPTGAQQIRYYWAGECDPPYIDDSTINSDLVGERFAIVRTWQASDLTPATVALLDAEMQSFAHQLRTRLDGAFTLSGTVTALKLHHGEPELTSITGNRVIAMKWELDLAYLEYAFVA